MLNRILLISFVVLLVVVVAEVCFLLISPQGKSTNSSSVTTSSNTNSAGENQYSTNSIGLDNAIVSREIKTTIEGKIINIDTAGGKLKNFNYSYNYALTIQGVGKKPTPVAFSNQDMAKVKFKKNSSILASPLKVSDLKVGDNVTITLTTFVARKGTSNVFTSVITEGLVTLQ